MIAGLLAAAGRIATIANTIERTIAIVESWSHSTLNPLPRNGLRSDFATPADIRPKPAVCIHAPMASTIAENARRIRPSNFIVMPSNVDKSFTRKLSRNEEENSAGLEIDSARCLLFRSDHIAALDRTRQVGPLNRDVAEVHRDSRAHQWIGSIADVEVQMRLGRIAG